MAYVTGTVNSMADLLTNIRSACTDNGWTLSGNVLHKTGGPFVQITSDAASLLILGGSGIDGSNALTGAGPRPSLFAALASDVAITFPLTYYVHVNTSPDEVVAVFNYGVVYWGWLAFGRSPVGGSALGSWYGSTTPSTALPPYNGGIGISPTAGGQGSGWGNPSRALFWDTHTIENSVSCFVQHDFDGGAWSTTDAWSSSTGSRASAITGIGNLVARQPNIWNSETVLLPIQPYVGRGGGFYSMCADLGHARYIRNDNYADGEVLSIGSDKWKTYPWYRKDIVNRDAGIYTQKHTGTMGWAIRYDGP